MSPKRTKRLMPTVPKNSNPPDTIEDLEFLLSWGVTREEAAKRTGFYSVNSLKNFCESNGRGELFLALAP